MKTILLKKRGCYACFLFQDEWKKISCKNKYEVDVDSELGKNFQSYAYFFPMIILLPDSIDITQHVPLGYPVFNGTHYFGLILVNKEQKPQKAEYIEQFIQFYEDNGLTQCVSI